MHFCRCHGHAVLGILCHLRRQLLVVHAGKRITVEHHPVQLGIRIRSREGWLYPASEQAQSVLELLILEARFRKVKIKTRETAVAVEKAENGYLVRTEGWQYPADSVIICCGSCASQIAGSDGDTLRFADQLQLASIPFFPALCPLRCKVRFVSPAKP